MRTEWNTETYADFLDELRSYADSGYRDFQVKLTPGLDKPQMLGVRMPVLRSLGKELSKGDPRGFLKVCGNDYYEEAMLRGIVTGLVKPESYEEFLALADGFLPYVTNWALCDCFCAGLKYVKKCREPFFEHLESLLSGGDWQKRVALVLMLDYYLDDGYIDRVLARVDAIRSDVYYVSMAQAWLIATALAKCPEQTLRYYRQNSLPDETHNRAIQKAIESRRISDETKKMLRTLKRS